MALKCLECKEEFQGVPMTNTFACPCGAVNFFQRVTLRDGSEARTVWRVKTASKDNRLNPCDNPDCVAHGMEDIELPDFPRGARLNIIASTIPCPECGRERAVFTS